MNAAERRLARILQLLSVPLLCALPCALLPFGWMDWVHHKLGLGTLPNTPIVPYLARSCSLFYAIHGALFLFLSRDVRRFLPVVAFLGWAGLAFGAALVPVDWLAGLPPHWCVAEGPLVVLLSLGILELVRRARPAPL
jgi:hypothetical protein